MYVIVPLREICLGSCAINALTVAVTTNNTSSAIHNNYTNIIVLYISHPKIIQPITT